jgi:hypothetical protein
MKYQSHDEIIYARAFLKQDAEIHKSNGQTPLYKQVGQLVVQHHQRTCWVLASPVANKLYNLLGSGLARGSVEFISQQVANLLANLFV